MKSPGFLKKTILPVIAFGGGLFVGLLFPSESSKLTENRSLKNFRFINPLLECDLAKFQYGRLDFLKSKLTDIIDQDIENKKITFASFYIRDLNNGPWIGHKQEELFSPASLIKVPIMIAYFKIAENNPEILKQTLDYNPDIKSISQNINPSETMEKGRSYTIEELIRRMIVYSDNIAYELLNNNIPSSKIMEVYHDLGVDISRGFADPNGNIVSVGQYSSFFRILFNSSYLDKKYSEKALELLSQVEYKHGLVAGVNNPSIPIAHKFGERHYVATGERQLHDCGIIYIPNKPHLVCIMTRGKDLTALESTIKEVASAAYQYISSN